MVISRREFLGFGAGLVASGVLGAALHEPYEIAVTQLDIRLKRLPPALDGLRVAQLSDIHFNSYLLDHHLVHSVELVNSLKPDLVMLTGDFVTAGFHGNRRARAEHAWPCGEILQRIKAPLGCFAVLGNHDYDTNAEIVTEALNATRNIEVLRNRAAEIWKNGARLWVVGVDNVTKGRARPDEALRSVPVGECKLVAVHEPDFADAMVKYPVDLQLSGHSHGGQILFPLVGALYFPPGARKYSRGHFQIGELQLYTNSGIGVIGVPMRFLCPPEISLFTLRSA